MYSIVRKRKIWFIVSGIIIIPGMIAIILGGLKLGIDFTGGSLLRVSFLDQNPTIQQVAENVNQTFENIENSKVQKLDQEEYTIRMPDLTNDKHQEVLSNLQSEFGNLEEKSFESIGPTIGQELKQKAIVAIILVLLFIIIYISIAFRKIGGPTVKSWVYGIGAVVALIHDILVVFGIFAILGLLLDVEIDILFITALLTVLGFSVHDTIVVYDRVRERLTINKNKSFEETVNESVNQTLIRSLNTSITTLLVLLALFLFGGQSIKYFIIALIIGIISGTYSSIFIASPFLVTWQKISKK